MKRSRARYWKVLLYSLLVVLLISVTGMALGSDQGSLTIIEPDGKPGQGCPLEHTSVKAEISGFVARVTVKQIFHNPQEAKIEAIYTFPLSAEGAVDEMLMKVGDRVVRGLIKRREEARRIYEQAKERGHVASLLDQERPNIFTQSVANIMPGEKVEITIKYLEILPYNDGAFSFVFPMVVGPRFIPGAPTGKRGTGWAPDTSQVPDASKITPPVTPDGTRAGHDIDLTVEMDAGVAIEQIHSKLHEVEVSRQGEKRARVALKNKKEIPNKDFVLTYTVAGDKVRSGILTHKEGKEGYAAIIMIPPKRVKPEEAAPKEMIFVIDCSGSQRGKPIEKAKETMRYVIDHMNPNDTFNVIDFNQGARMLFSAAKKNTPENRNKALTYLNSLNARGGTWMGPAIETVCNTPAPENRLRIVTFMTDGYVGNDFEIISMVKRLRGKSRWFPFGTGNSVNRFLLDNMARVGGGEVEYILLDSPGEEIAKKFYTRIAAPVLTDLKLTVEGIKLEEVFPGQLSDLWDRKPLIFKAQYSAAGKGAVTIKGFAAGKPYEQTLHVTLPDKEPANASLGSLWARAKVDNLMDRDWMGIQQGKPKPEIKEKIIEVALAHGIMTQYTSFVAVEEAVVTVGGKPTRVTVPVEMPDGVSREGVFGDKEASVEASRRRPVTIGANHHWTYKAQSISKERPVRGAYVKAHPPSTVIMPQPARGAAPASLGPHGLPSQRLQEPPAKAESPREETAGIAGEAEADRVSASPAEKKAFAYQQKLAPELRVLIAKKGKVEEFSDGKVTVNDGKVRVKVWLNRMSDDLLERLKKMGLDVSYKAISAKMVIGTIAVEKLEELVKFKEVRLIEPLSIG